MKEVSVQVADFDVGTEIAALSAADPMAGAVASFVGLVRADKLAEQKAGSGETASQPERPAAVTAMTLEHYPGMTEQALADIVAAAQKRWELRTVRVIHRVGRLLPGERIVFVGVSSAHRGDAFAACEFIMDYLKTQAPFWKKEETPEGGRWVDARTTDDLAAKRWQPD
ncbi:MAG: molybdopterin synthase catalytic subunit MoaE [Gammaproteobacteria bacterium]|nr:molybdopterin synthase catalytic subunit MoaE [Rhodocyclaceae bacterium]MBU3908483.1 molybdopterin synthase catalytic subunit MoaE [Gammaproteobacteria bacterium]MBU3988634.1 molybdopterin synthase catalytic subunit MoaE [Gammaproteobacteria bacterium]MBU4004511.1 molybdopterin synthase catalytic subunit MoaE [Gammaproteobacteria bacterium]MBU4021114.1 molybdopterin synthase catalytic subunit MoaE [Gammaproteobacteria bacterium]